MADEPRKPLEFWQERLQTGEVVGRDPRKMTRLEFEEMGHRAKTPLQALRERCVDCCAGQVTEVRYCTARKCPSWPFRMGKSPWRDKVQLSEAERERRRALMERTRKARRIVVEEPEVIEETVEEPPVDTSRHVNRKGRLPIAPPDEDGQ